MPDSNAQSLFLSSPVDSNDKRPLPEIIAERCGFALAHHDIEGKRYYAVQDWLMGVAQPAEARKFWDALKRRLKKVGIELSTLCRQLPYRASDGKTYQVEYADAETLYLITQRMDANTGIRNAVLKFLAAAGVEIDEYRIEPSQAIEAAIRAYERMGKTPEWIATRIKSIITRNAFTKAFQKCQRVPPEQRHYQLITDTLRVGLWKRNSATLRKQLGLAAGTNIRDHLSELALTYEMLVEQASTYQLDQKTGLDFQDTDQIVGQNAKVIGKSAAELGRHLGIDIATNKPLIAGKT